MLGRPGAQLGARDARRSRTGLERVRDALQATEEPGAIAVPLQVRDDLIGLLIAYPKDGS